LVLVAWQVLAVNAAITADQLTQPHLTQNLSAHAGHDFNIFIGKFGRYWDHPFSDDLLACIASARYANCLLFDGFLPAIRSY
jgi:hypothetical protein